jgi:hypothetical protein
LVGWARHAWYPVNLLLLSVMKNGFFAVTFVRQPTGIAAINKQLQDIF